MTDVRRAARTTARARPLTARTPQFLTNHALVLVYVVLHPDSTVRAISEGIGITERATLAILRDLDEDAIVERHRLGRRNVYSVNFARLSSVRRGGSATALTPRPFVEAVVKMLFDLSHQPEGAPIAPKPPKPVAPERLEPRAGTWGFFTNHMLILLAIARDRRRTVRELASEINITERAAMGILNQLEAEGVLSRRREGRRNAYGIDLAAFRNFAGWTFDDWAIPAKLIDAATEGIRALSGRAERPAAS